MVLKSGARTLSLIHSQHRNIKKLRNIVPESLLVIHPFDAESRGIYAGNEVTVTSLRGSIRVIADVTDKILKRGVQVPHH